MTRNDPAQKQDPDRDAGQRRPGEIGDAGDSGASRPIKIDDIREPEEKLLAADDDQADFDESNDSDAPEIPSPS